MREDTVRATEPNGAKLQDDFRRDAWRHGCGKEDRFSFTACGRRGRGEQYEKKALPHVRKGFFVFWWT